MRAKTAKDGAARTAEEVGHHEHRVQPAAGLGTQSVGPRLVGDECGTIAKIEENHARDQAGEAYTARRDKSEGHHDGDCAGRSLVAGTDSIGSRSDLWGRHEAENTDKPESSDSCRTELVGRPRQQVRQLWPKAR